jgi:FkbM family methyltransferase
MGIGAALERSDWRAHERGQYVEQGPWQSDHEVAVQAMARLGRVDPDLVSSVLDLFDGPDAADQVRAHPWVPLRVLQLTHLTAALAGVPVEPTAAGSVVSADQDPLAWRRSVRNSRGMRLHVDPADPRGVALVAAGGDLNPTSLRIWQGLVAERAWDLVVDVGANYGEMLLGCVLPPGAQVQAYEPNPAILPFLRRSVAGHEPPIEVRPVAVAERPGLESFFMDPTWSGTSALSTGAGHGKDVVPCVTLDADLQGLSVQHACIKVDVEGAEMRVLEGARGLLSSLDDYACMVEILHLPPESIGELSRAHRLFLWDLRAARLSRVAPSGAGQIQALLATGAFYRQDAVLRRAG